MLRSKFTATLKKFSESYPIRIERVNILGHDQFNIYPRAREPNIYTRLNTSTPFMEYRVDIDDDAMCMSESIMVYDGLNTWTYSDSVCNKDGVPNDLTIEKITKFYSDFCIKQIDQKTTEIMEIHRILYHQTNNINMPTTRK